MAAGPGNWTLGNYRRFHMDGYGVNQDLSKEVTDRSTLSHFKEQVRASNKPNKAVGCRCPLFHGSGDITNLSQRQNAFWILVRVPFELSRESSTYRLI
jgi:hypothetical protein